MSEEIYNIEIVQLTNSDYEDLKTVMISAYQSMPDAYWKQHQIENLIQKFPEGQVVLKINGAIAGAVSVEAEEIKWNES